MLELYSVPYILISRFVTSQWCLITFMHKPLYLIRPEAISTKKQKKTQKNGSMKYLKFSLCLLLYFYHSRSLSVCWEASGVGFPGGFSVSFHQSCAQHGQPNKIAIALEISFFPILKFENRLILDIFLIVYDFLYVILAVSKF